MESRRSCRDVACYRPHSHDRFSIGLIDSGTTVFTGAAGASIPLTAGDVVLIPAHHVHACNPNRGRWRYQMIHADQDWIVSLLPQHTEHLLHGISVYRHPGMHRRLTALNDLLFQDVDADRLEAEFRRCFRGAHREPLHHITRPTDAELLARLRPVLDRLSRDESNPAIDELAQLVGMSRYQLIRAMKRATGFTPLAWRQNSRVIAARRMLRDGRALAETAHVLGFVDQSHLHRVFRAHVAASPGDYRG